MPDGSQPLLPHLALSNRSIEQDYAPRAGRSRALKLKHRDREAHAKARLAELERLEVFETQRQAERAAEQLVDFPDGITIEFRSAFGFDLAYEKLDLKSQGIELLNVRESLGLFYATVFVPAGKLGILKKRVTDYLTKSSPNSKSGRAANADLVESIESIGVATLQALWTDEAPIPDVDDVQWWEVWIRRDNLPAAGAFARFLAGAEHFGLKVSQQRLDFPERIVVTIYASLPQLGRAVDLLNLVAEVRRADRPPVLPHNMGVLEQDAFVEELVGRLQPCSGDLAVTILDTGVARMHPLLTPYASEADMLAVDPDWGHADHHGHGTQMAGLALYGDLRDHAQSDKPIQPSCVIESVKLIAPAGGSDDLVPLGAISQQAVYLSEIVGPLRKRVFCKAVTSDMHQDGGPSSYSSAIDQLAFGDEGGGPRLMVVSAGNTPDEGWLNYPESNYCYGIEQPGQAWNVLTVGAYTEKDFLPASVDYAGWSAVADRGNLSPFSATSREWDLRWPIKPEVLFEGGNAAVDESVTQHGIPDSLQLITTSRNFTVRPLRPFSMTSAATALAARFGAKVWEKYPDYWPETVRALSVHWADWTDAQKRKHLANSQSKSKRFMLRICGYGVVDEERALSSTSRRVTLVAQEVLQPFKLSEGKGRMNELKVFELPWPRELLEKYHDADVELRITLSYFIEPNPSNRGWKSKYRYSSHGLRFSLRRLNESVADFAKRTNEAMTYTDDDEARQAPDDSQGWLLGEDLRTSGSVHSDRWTGSAIELATRNLIAVYPVVGWWRERKQLGCVESEARFAMVVSLDFLDVDAPVYAGVQNELTLKPELLPELEVLAELNRNVLAATNGTLEL